MADGTILNLGTWEDVTSQFTPITGVTGFEAYYNPKLHLVFFYGKSPSSYTTGNTLVTIPNAYKGESRNHTTGGFYGGDGSYVETVVNNTTILARRTTATTAFTTSFDFYGFYRIAS